MSDPYLDAITATYDDLDRWRDRGREVERPEPGSELFEDDSIFPRSPVSEIARTSLLTSGEHLRLARDAIRQKQIYPSAQFTVLRGSLVGAAQAVWILAPADRATRQERALTVLTETHKQMVTYHNEIATFRLTPEKRRLVQEQVEWLTQRQSGVDRLRTSRMKLEQTAFVAAALNHTFKDRARREDGRGLWRQISADAHALGWSMWQRSTMSSSDQRSSLSIGVAGGSLEDIAQPFVCCHLLLKEGWILFDRRCEGP